MGRFVTQRRVTVTNPLDTMTPEELLRAPFPVDTGKHEFAIISYVGPRTTPKTPGWMGVRIYCTCPSFEEAERICKKAQERGFSHFDLFIVAIGEGFFPLPPPPDAAIANLCYSDEVLNELVVRDQRDREEASKKVEARASEDMTVSSVNEAFDKCVSDTALRLFEDWKASGQPDDAETVSTKLAGELTRGMADKIKAM